MIKIGLIDFTPADKIIEIRDKNQIIKAKYAISATDILKHTLMSEHYIEISFLYNKNIAFKRSDYILWNGEKFTLREDYIPEQVNKYKYQYTLKFEATEMLFQDIQFYYLNQNLKESEWRLAGNAEYFIKIAVDNANRYFGVTDFKVGVIEPAEVKDIIFDTNTNTFDALIQIAESYEAEWNMTGKTINLVKKVSFGAEVDFETEVSVLSMSRSEGENSTKYTRILALGSTRNIPKDYRGSTPGESVDAVYPKRLRIPAAKGDVIDAFPNMSPDEVVEGTVIFDEVYPKRVGTVGAVGTIEYADTDEETGEVTKWNAFKIKDPGINFKEEYVLPGEELRLTFQSGDLNGFDFALKFHKDGFSKTDNSQYFEIVRSEDYGKKMPNDTMKPKAGDKYVLYGFNISLVSDQYVPAGEQELFDTASAWLQKQLQDTSVYDCPTVIDYFKKHEMDLEVGQKVKLIKDLSGSRNLLPNTNKGVSGWSRNIQNGTQAYTEVEALGVRACKSTTSIVSTGYHVLTHSINRSLIKNNTQYTLSLDIYCEFATSATFRLMNMAGLNQLVYFGTKAIPANSWTHIELTATTNAETATNQYLYITDFNKLGSVTFANLKLEEGNKATSWTPAPEDVDGMIRSSRIMGYEKKLYNKYDATYTVGDNSAYNRLTAIEKNIKELQYAGVVYESTGSGGVYLIKQFDTTTPSDHNAYSAKASDAKYFNKQTGGAVQGDTLFQKNIQVQGSAISDVFQNSTFTAGQLGSGFQIKRDANGQSYMEIDNLMVRRETVFNRLTIAEIKSVGGTILLSLANMVISKVEDKTSAWRCYFDNADGTIPNDFAISDQVICRKYTGKNIKYYWSKVTSVGVDFIEISKTDKDGSGVPAIADEIIQLGNRNDVNRQYAIMLSAYGSDAPSIKQYAGINSYDMTGKEVTTISPKGNKFTGSFTVSTNGTTAPVYKERQVFTNGTVYYLNDRVSHLGSYWVCIVESTITTPSETSLAWRKDTAGQTDINNAVDNISVGGRNLVPNTNKGAMWWWRTVQNGTHSITEVEALGVRAMKATTSVVSTGYNVITKGLKQSLLKNNTQYIVSFDIYSEFDTSFSISLREGSSANALTGNYFSSIKKDTWTHIEQIITTNNVAIENQLIYFDGFNKVGSVTIANLKLEEGNKATSWTPAPEDVQTGIDNAQTSANNALDEAKKVRTEYKADFVILDTKIASKVSQTDFNALGNRVSQTESSITQQAGQITSVVEKVDNIKIGSRNILPNTNQGISGWGAFLQNGTVTRSEVEALGVRACKLTTTVLSTGYHVLYHSINRSLIKNNTQYTLSVDVFCEFATTATFRLIALNAVNSLAYFGSKAIPANIWTRVELTATTNSDTGTNQYLYITDFNKLGSVTFANLKLEEGNKVTSWTPAPEDVQIGIDKAQNAASDAQSAADNAQDIANSKNRSYYQDIAPSIPNGGHKVGDLWYKDSLVDSSGNINSDPSKNIYQLQYRWDGTTWRQINWSVSKSKIEQTDSSISLLVEKTGINSVGAGSSLYSIISQNAEEIRLEVSSIKVGGTNLLPNTNKGVSGWARNIQNGSYAYSEVESLGVRACKFTTSVASTGWHVLTHTINRSLIKNNTQYTLSLDIYSEFATSAVFRLMSVAGLNQLVHFGSKYIPANTWTRIELTATTNSNTETNQVLYITDFNKLGAVTFANLKLEEGNKATSWTPAPEDVQAGIDNAQNTADSKTTLDEVSSSLTLTDNKISLASKTIELKGTTIAKAIEAEDLKVGSRLGLSTLEALKDGTFYAKGSKSINESLTIDSGTQSIEIISPYSASWDDDGGSTPSGRSTVRISSQSGGVEVRDSNYNASVVSTNGVFANKAGQGMYPASSGVNAKAAIVGLGNGSVYADYSGLNFIAGVYGRASNTSTAPAYGGYFDMLRANGLVLSTLIIEGSTTKPYDISVGTSFVCSLSTVQQNIYLPTKAYRGTIIRLKQWNTGFMRIYPSSGALLYDDSSRNDNIDIGEGWTAECICLGTVTVNGSATVVWLLGKYKF